MANGIPCSARWVGRGLLWLWGPTSVVLVAAVMVSHLLALPTPEARALEAALFAADQGRQVAGWRAFHVLYADCPCSRRVAESLVARGARDDFSERVLLVGHDAGLSRQLGTSGFSVDELTAETLKDRLGIEAAPTFFAVAPDGSVRYVGGYSSYKQGPSQDERLLSLVRHGLRPEALPVFGCAVSRRLQAAADPFGLRYTAEVAP